MKKYNLLAAAIAVSVTVMSCTNDTATTKDENAITTTTTNTTPLLPEKRGLAAHIDSNYHVLPKHDTIGQALSKTNKTVDSDMDHSRPPKPTKRVVNLTVKGDFDGDGSPENWNENYLSQLTQKPIKRDLYAAIDQLQQNIPAQEPITTLQADKSTLNSLQISNDAYQYGLAYLKNEGDLDGDGADELSYVIDNIDQSNINKMYVVSYKNGAWKELYSFTIRESTLPIYSIKNKERFIHKLEGGKMLVKFVNEQAFEEYQIVDLKKGINKPMSNLPMEQRMLVMGDSITIPTFTIHFQPTPEINKILKEGKEKIEISWTIAGEAQKKVNVTKKDYYNSEEGIIYLKNTIIEMPTDERKITLSGNVSQEAFRALIEPDMEMTLNFYSSRLSSENNIFASEALIEPISVLRGKTKQIKVAKL